MADLEHDLKALLRYAQGGGAPDDLLDRVERPVLRLAETSATEQFYQRIRKVWKKHDYLRSGQRYARVHEITGASHTTIWRATRQTAGRKARHFRPVK